MELALCLFRGNVTSIGEVEAEATPPPGLPPLLLATVSRTLRFMRRSAAFFSGPCRGVAVAAAASIVMGFFFSSFKEEKEEKGVKRVGECECGEEFATSSRFRLLSRMRKTSLCS